MLTLQTSVAVEEITGSEIFHSLVDPNDRAYQAWWPGVHLRSEASSWRLIAASATGESGSSIGLSSTRTAQGLGLAGAHA